VTHLALSDVPICGLTILTFIWSEAMKHLHMIHLVGSDEGREMIGNSSPAMTGNSFSAMTGNNFSASDRG
jgi:hypothetical protein